MAEFREIEQHKLKRKRGTFGPFGNLMKNGCGAIALFHVLRLSGEDCTFSEMVRDFRKHWWYTTLFGGLMGTNPLYLFRVLKKMGFRLTCYRVGKGREILPEHQLYLNLYLHHSGAHYSVSRWENGKLRTWNDPDSQNHGMYCRQVGAVAMLVFGLDREVSI